MKAILIVMLSFAIDGGAASAAVEFRSRELCELARKAVLAQVLDESSRNWGRRNVIAVCVDA